MNRLKNKKVEGETNIDRRDFIFIEENKQRESENTPIRIGHGQTTSQPSLIDEMLNIMYSKYDEYNKNNKYSVTKQRRKTNNMTGRRKFRNRVKDNPAIRALDIGSGSGIVTVKMAYKIGNSHIENRVIGIELIKELSDQSETVINRYKTLNKNAAKMEIRNLDIYNVFKKTPNLGQFDLIYVGAEPKENEEISTFKTQIPILLKRGGVAIAPINGNLHLYVKTNRRNEQNKNEWQELPKRTRFVPLKDTTNITNDSIIGGGNKSTRTHARVPNLSLLEKKQLGKIRREKETRTSFGCDDHNFICNIPAITARSAHLYKSHLFADFPTQNSLDKWCKNKCIIDLGAGANHLYDRSFISRLMRKNLAYDIVASDYKSPRSATKTAKKRPRFVKGNLSKLNRATLRLRRGCNTVGGPSVKNKVVMIHNVFYLWLDTPTVLKRAFANILAWLNRGDEIRVFPVYYGRYDMYDSGLRKFIEDRCVVKSYRPRYAADGLVEWNPKTKKMVYISTRGKSYEKDINKEMDARLIIFKKR